MLKLPTRAREECPLKGYPCCHSSSRSLYSGTDAETWLDCLSDQYGSLIALINRRKCPSARVVSHKAITRRSQGHPLPTAFPCDWPCGIAPYFWLVTGGARIGLLLLSISAAISQRPSTRRSTSTNLPYSGLSTAPPQPPMT